jgi:hypothetical protein
MGFPDDHIRTVMYEDNVQYSGHNLNSTVYNLLQKNKKESKFVTFRGKEPEKNLY